MFPWAAIVGLAGQAASGILSANANRKAQQRADEEYARQKAFYETQMYQDPLQRSENQALLGALKRQLDEQNEQAVAVSKITGATPEMQVAMNQNAANAYGNAVGNMMAGESARREEYAEKLNKAYNDKANADIARWNDRQQSFANIASNAANMFTTLLSGYKGKKLVWQPDDGTGGTDGQDKQDKQ